MSIPLVTEIVSEKIEFIIGLILGGVGTLFRDMREKKNSEQRYTTLYGLPVAIYCYCLIKLINMRWMKREGGSFLIRQFSL